MTVHMIEVEDTAGDSYTFSLAGVVVLVDQHFLADGSITVRMECADHKALIFVDSDTGHPARAREWHRRFNVSLDRAMRRMPYGGVIAWQEILEGMPPEDRRMYDPYIRDTEARLAEVRRERDRAIQGAHDNLGSPRVLTSHLRSAISNCRWAYRLEDQIATLRALRSGQSLAGVARPRHVEYPDSLLDLLQQTDNMSLIR